MSETEHLTRAARHNTFLDKLNRIPHRLDDAEGECIFHFIPDLTFECCHLRITHKTQQPEEDLAIAQ
jgi:hypothetical protein